MTSSINKLDRWIDNASALNHGMDIRSSLISSLNLILYIDAFLFRPW